MKILVIAPAAFHLGYLGCYGNAWIETPHLDALAAESAVFDNHYSDCPSVDGAWRAWRTGHHDFPRSGFPFVFFPPRSTDILPTLRAKGIPAWWVTDPAGAPCPEAGIPWEELTLIQGGESPGMLSRKVMKFVRQMKWFDHGLIWVQPDFLLPSWRAEDLNPDYFSGNTDEESVDALLEPLPNPPLGLLDPSDEITFLRLQRTYAAAVTCLDRELQELWEQLRQSDFYDSLMIIITTDRGFPLGEHGLVGDSRPWLHEELVHIPLIIRLPNQAAAGQRISALTQPVDLMPTLLEAYDFPLEETDGSSLLPLINGEKERIRDFACSGMRKGGVIEYALRTPDWAFLLPEQPGQTAPPRDRQLYVKPDDRWEVNNVWQHHPEVAEHLEKILRTIVKAPTSEAQG